MSQAIRTKPVPYCPDCGALMALRKPRSTQTWLAFWGCSQFPGCEGTRQIMSNGMPEEDENYSDYEDNTWREGHPMDYGDR